MKKTIPILIALLLNISTVWAQNYDFSRVAPSGQTLCYKKISGYYDSGYDVCVCFSLNSTMSGGLIIPSRFVENRTLYRVTAIGNNAFDCCRMLTSVTIPNTVTSIGHDAFKKCTSLTSISIPNSVTSIEYGAFRECTSLTSISIPNSVRYIKEQTFAGCTSLTSIDIPNVISLGEQAFSGCTSLTSINYHGTNISRWVFYGCTSLTSISIPISVSYIESFAFAGCTSLTSINIPNTVTAIRDKAFYGCSSLTSINIPNSVTFIGDSAFYGCTSLTSINIPNSVTFLRPGAFSNCTRLTSVTLPNSLACIADGQFNNCMGLTRIICLADFPPICDIRAFENVSSTIPVYVPCGSTASYQSRWTCFSNFIEFNNNYMITVLSVDETKGSARISTMPGCDNNIAVIEATANYGYHFTQWNDGDISTSRTILLTQDTTFTAYFSPNQYTLTVTAGEHGTVSGSSGTYNYGDTITIQAYPEMNYRFTRWSDGVTTNPRTIVVSGNNTITANFALLTFSINANSNNDTMGSVTGSGYYAINSEVTLQARPNSGYAFARWSDGVTTNPRTIIANADTTITAIFEAAVIVTANSNNDLMGSVIGGGQYLRNTEVTLQAIPRNGYRFVRWDDGVTTNPRTITVTDDISLTAIFELDNVTVIVNRNDALMGSVTGGGNYLRNSEVTLQATPNRGYHFVRWSDNITDNPRTLTVSGDTTLTAYFEAITITLTVNSNDDMMGSVSGGGWFEAHTELTLQAIPNNGYRFVRWNDNVTDNPRTVTPFSDTTFTAYFAADENTGIDGVETLNAMIYTSNGQIVVDGTERNTVWLYDATGRLLSTKQNDYSLLRFSVPTSGTYFIKIGKRPAQKVVVTK